MPFGFTPTGFALLVLFTFLICTTVNTFAMEAAVLFTPAFLFVYPAFIPGFPELGAQGAIGLSLFVELFGYTSSVSGYYLRRQVDLHAAAKILLVSVPVAIVARVVSYLVPSTALMGLFGGMLLLLAGVMFEAERHGSSVLADLVGALPHDVGGEGVAADYVPRTRMMTDGGTPEMRFDALDRVAAGVGGALAGLVGIAIGEVSNTLLTVRKRLPVGVATGTSALVLHVTILGALATNVGLLEFAPAMAGEEFTVPFGVGTILGCVCLVGGQTGAYVNSRLSEDTAVTALMVAYSVVGTFVLAKVLLL